MILRNPMKIKELLELIKDKDPDSDVIESGIYLEEEFETTCAPIQTKSIKPKKFKTYKEALMYFIEIYKETEDVPDVDYYIIHRGYTIYGTKFCEAIYYPKKRGNILIQRRFATDYWKEKAKELCDYGIID